MAVNNYQVVAFTETGLNEHFYTGELGFDTYNVFRLDRSAITSTAQRLGGVLIAVHESIPSRLIRSTDDIEQVYVLVGSGKKQMIVGCIYLPPNSPLEKYESVSNNLEAISQQFNNSGLCIMGDFNLPKATWVMEELCSAVNRPPNGYLAPAEIEKMQLISEICSLHNLFQLNNVQNINNVILDLVLCQSQFPITQPHIDETLLPLDNHHPPLLLNINMSKNHNRPSAQGDEYYYDFKSANFNDINEYLGYISWDNLFAGKTVEEMTTLFYEILYHIFDVFVPKKKNASSKFPKWFSQDLKSLTIQKKIAHKKYKVSKLPLDYQNFSNLRTQCNILSKQCFQNYITYTEASLQQNPKTFWSYTNSLYNSSKQPSNYTLNNKSASMGSQAAELFAEYFGSVYSNKSLLIPNQPSLSLHNLYNLIIPISDIYTELRNISPDKGPGPDMVHPLFLKNCCFVLSRPLHIIFNKSLHDGVFPDYCQVLWYQFINLVIQKMWLIIVL